MRNKLIGQYPPEIESALTEIFNTTPFDFLEIENVYVALKTITATKAVLTAAQRYGLSPCDVMIPLGFGGPKMDLVQL